MTIKYVQTMHTDKRSKNLLGAQLNKNGIFTIFLIFAVFEHYPKISQKTFFEMKNISLLFFISKNFQYQKRVKYL